MIRDLWWKFFSLAQRLLGQGLAWNIATWLGHGSLTFLGGLLHERVAFGLASAYTFREFEQWLEGRPTTLADSIGDVLAPWVAYILVLLTT